MAARFFVRHHRSGTKRKAVATAIEETIAAKKAKGVSDVYLADLRYRLGVFSQAFHCDVSAIVPDDVATFLDSLRLSPRSQKATLTRRANASCAENLSLIVASRLPELT